MWRAVTLPGRLLLRYIRGFDHPGKIRVVRTIARNLFREGILLSASNGARIRAEASDFIGWAMLRTGAYEPRTLTRAAMILANGGYFVDAGAHMGLFTVYLGSLPGVTCVCIEPHARSFVKLQKNVRLNHTLTVRAYHGALSDRGELLDLEEISPGNSGTVRVHSDDKHSTKDIVIVAACPLQHVLEHVDLESVTLLKMDIEGFELRALEGLDWQGKRRPRNVIVEFSDYTSRFDGQGRSSLLRFFADKGYSAYSVDGQPLSDTDSPTEDNAWFRDDSGTASMLL